VAGQIGHVIIWQNSVVKLVYANPAIGVAKTASINARLPSFSQQLPHGEHCQLCQCDRKKKSCQVVQSLIDYGAKIPYSRILAQFRVCLSVCLRPSRRLTGRRTRKTPIGWACANLTR